MADDGNWDLKLQMLIADTWDDAELKQRLLDDPAKVLAERGIAIPDGVAVNVVADTEETIHLVLPPAPADDMLSEEELESVAGGFALCRGPRCRPAPTCRCRPAPTCRPTRTCRPTQTCRCNRCRPSSACD